MKEGGESQGKGGEETPSTSSNKLSEAGSDDEEEVDTRFGAQLTEVFWRDALWALANDPGTPDGEKRRR
eukprot:15656587-Heterocapsa_arctica.AAC.1